MADVLDDPERFDEKYWAEASHYSRYGSYAAGFEELSGWFSGLVKLVAPLLPPTPARVVDAGCGHGVLVAAFAKRGYDAYGFDPSRWIVDEARKYDAEFGARLEVGTIEEFPFSGDVDAITCFEVLEHIDDPVAALVAMRDALRPGGRLIFTTPNLEPRSWWKDPRTSDPTHVNVHGRNWWEGAARAAGLRVTAATTFSPVQLTWRIHPALGHWQKLGKRLGPQVLIAAERV